MTILDTPSAAVGLDVERFPTAVLPKATSPFAGNELVAILQEGRNVYADVSAIGGGGGTGGVRSAGVSNLGNTLGLTGLITAGALVLAGIGAITLSQQTDAQGATVSVSAPVQSVQTQDRFDLTIGGNTAGAGALISSGTMSLVGGANVTLSQAGNAVTISAAAGGGANFSAGVSNLGNTLGSTGVTGTRLVFAGGNSVTLSQSTDANGATITISGATTPAQTAESNTFGMSNLGNTAGTSGVISGPQLRMLLAGGPNVTLSQSINGSSATVSFSVAAQSVQTQGQFSGGVSNLGNFAGSTGVTGTRLVFVGSNNIALGQSTDANGGTITISAQGLSNYSAGASNLGNTAGSTGVTGTRLVLVGSNNITLSQSTDANGGTLSIIGAAGGAAFSAGVSTGGNTAGATGITGTRLVFVGSNNVTLSQTTDANGGTISFFAPSPSGGNFSAGVSNLGNTAGSTGLSGTQLVLVGTRGISLSQSTGANGATVSIDFTQSVQTQGQFSAGASNLGNTAGSTGVTGTRLVLVGTGGVSLSQSTDANGGTLSINFTQSAESQSIGASNLGNTLGTSGVASGAQVRAVIIGTSNITVSQSVNGASATLSLIGQPSFSAGVSTMGNTAGSTGITGTRLVLVGTGGVSLSQSTDANGGTLSINFTQSAESQSIGASNLGNTLGTSGVASGAQVRAVIIGTSNITVSQSVNGASATLSLIGQPAFSAGVSNLGNSAGATGITGTRLVLVGTNNITLSQTTDANGATISFSGQSPAGGAFSAGVSNFGNTLGDTGITGTRVVFVGTSNVTLSQLTDANGATIRFLALPSFSAGVSTIGNTAGATGVTGTRLVFVGSNSISLSQTTDANGATITFDHSRGIGVSTGGNTAGNTSVNGSQVVLAGKGIVTLNQATGANGNTISISAPDALTMDEVFIPNWGGRAPDLGTLSNASLHVAPFSVDNYHTATAAALLFSVSGNNTGTMTATMSIGIGIYTLNGASISVLSRSTNSLTVSYTSTQSSSSFHGGRWLTMPMDLNISPGQYWLGVWYRSSGGGMSFTNVLNGLPVVPFTRVSGVWGAASNVTKQVVWGMGEYSATVTTMPSSIAFSEIQATNASQQRIELVQFYNTSL